MMLCVRVSPVWSGYMENSWDTYFWGWYNSDTGPAQRHLRRAKTHSEYERFTTGGGAFSYLFLVLFMWPER